MNKIKYDRKLPFCTFREMVPHHITFHFSNDTVTCRLESDQERDHEHFA